MTRTAHNMVTAFWEQGRLWRKSAGRNRGCFVGLLERSLRTEPPANRLKYTRHCKNRHPSKVWGCSDDALTRRSATDSARPVRAFEICASPTDRASGQSKQTCAQIAPVG